MLFENFRENIVEELNEIKPEGIKEFRLIKDAELERMTPANTIRVVFNDDKNFDLVGYTKQLYARYESENIGLYGLASELIPECVKAHERIIAMESICKSQKHLQIEATHSVCEQQKSSVSHRNKHRH